MINKPKLAKNIKKLMPKGRALILAYDHGMEHGTSDFTDKTVNPRYVMDIARKGKFNAIVIQKGIAERYYDKRKDVPLIVKLNGKSRLRVGTPISVQVCSVKEAHELGAIAVGYTIYLGSMNEPVMLKEFGKVEEEAEERGMASIGWMYPRGESIKEITPKIIEYAARAALELGADFAKVNYSGSPESFKKVVNAAGLCNVFSLGGAKKSDKKLLTEARGAMDAGAAGMVVGRNIWQHKEPLKIARALRAIIFDDKSVKEALKYLK